MGKQDLKYLGMGTIVVALVIGVVLLYVWGTTGFESDRSNNDLWELQLETQGLIIQTIGKQALAIEDLEARIEVLEGTE